MLSNQRSIYSTPTARRFLTTKSFAEIVNFLTDFKSKIVVSPENQKKLFNTRGSSISPISKLFGQTLEMGKDSSYMFLNVRPGSDVSIPEIITYRWLTYDIKQMEVVQPNLYTALLPTIFGDKILVDVSPWINASGEVSDTSSIMASVVRGGLSRSYYSSTKVWISPTIARVLARTYSIALGVYVANKFNLNILEKGLLETYLAYYFLSKMFNSRNDAYYFMSANMREFRIQDSNMLADIVGYVNSVNDEATGHKGSDITLENVCSAISKRFGPKFKHGFSYGYLVRIFQTWGGDVYTSSVALEYPPYWFYLVLMAASGSKIPVNFYLKNTNEYKEVGTIVDEMSRSVEYFSKI